MPVEPPELEDFEAALGPERHCQRPDTYSRVSVMGSHGERWGRRQHLSQTSWLCTNLLCELDRSFPHVASAATIWVSHPLSWRLLLWAFFSLSEGMAGTTRGLEGELEDLVLKCLLTAFLPNCLCSHLQHLARKKSPTWRSWRQGVSPLSGPSPLRGLGLLWTSPSNPLSL